MNGRDALEAFIRWVMRDTTYLGTYICTVMGQVGQSLELKPDSDKLAGLSGLSQVPIRHGVPGMSAQVPPGTRVLLAFEDGDPQKPYAALWDGVAIEVSFAGGQQPVARLGDMITLTVATSPVGPVTGVGIISAGNPLVKA